jgi:hypothetical protein
MKIDLTIYENISDNFYIELLVKMKELRTLTISHGCNLDFSIHDITEKKP